jgi:hypothetical protein
MDKGNDVRYNPRLGVKRSIKMYIDPNTGGILFQALAAVFIAGSGILLFFSRNIREGIAKLRRRMRKDDEEQEK